MAAEFGAIADAGQHQELRGVDRAGRQDEFAPRTDRKKPAILFDLDADRAALIEQDATDMRPRHDREIGPVRKGMHIGAVQRLAPAAPDEHVGDGGAARPFHHRAIRARECRDALLARGAEKGVRQRARIVRGLHPHGAVGTAERRIGRPLPVFDAAIDVEHRFIGPAGIARLSGKMIPIAFVAPRPDHDIDARTAAETLAHRHRQFAAIEVRIGLGLKAPVAFAPKVCWPERGVHDRLGFVAATRLDQQNLCAAVLGKAAGNDRTR